MRNQKIIDSFLKGNTLQAIGEEFGITRQAVSYLLKKHLPDYGEIVEERREKATQDIEKTCDICTKIFSVEKAGSNRKYCSVDCRKKNYMVKRNEELFDKKIYRITVKKVYRENVTTYMDGVCECGTVVKKIELNNIVRGKTKSCGCLLQEHIRKVGDHGRLKRTIHYVGDISLRQWCKINGVSYCNFLTKMKKNKLTPEQAVEKYDKNR